MTVMLYVQSVVALLLPQVAESGALQPDVYLQLQRALAESS